MIGEQCSYLSAGEMQQLAVARALLSQAPVLMLDEPSANLDNLTGRELIENLVKSVDQRTLIMVVHRPLFCNMLIASL